MVSTVDTERSKIAWQSHLLEQVILKDLTPTLRPRVSRFLHLLDQFLTSEKVLSQAHHVLGVTTSQSASVSQAITDLNSLWSRLTYKITSEEKSLIDALLATRDVRVTCPDVSKRKATQVLHTPRGSLILT